MIVADLFPLECSHVRRHDGSLFPPSVIDTYPLERKSHFLRTVVGTLPSESISLPFDDIARITSLESLTPIVWKHATAEETVIDIKTAPPIFLKRRNAFGLNFDQRIIVRRGAEIVFRGTDFSLTYIEVEEQKLKCFYQTMDDLGACYLRITIHQAHPFPSRSVYRLE
jgi:hypothetical protein